MMPYPRSSLFHLIKEYLLILKQQHDCGECSVYTLNSMRSVKHEDLRKYLDSYYGDGVDYIRLGRILANLEKVINFSMEDFNLPGALTGYCIDLETLLINNRVCQWYLTKKNNVDVLKTAYGEIE